ncbi:MAG TPA: integrase arm-type DNA-binding domain-containing protein [Rhizomicrobium sp.]|nr:integrase arm-type DNA-binding domain-containing protein [Rhizomicrobium sp.]
MGRSIERLKALTVERSLKKPGMYCDGGGLWLCVSSTSAGSWIFRYQLQGKAREMGLGSARDISLQEARIAAAAARKVKAMGSDPLEERKRIVAERRAEAARAISFKQSAESYIDAHRAGWKNAKHAAQWTATLSTYAYPTIGGLPVAAVDVALVHKVLSPIWTTKPETASRVRGRIESILDWATTRGYRIGENPARWRGHLENLFPKRSKIRKVEHHAALPYSEIPEFMTSLAQQAGEGARALLFAILTAARTGEVIGARGAEIDTRAGVWTVPADRMKAGREHRVPLGPSALALRVEESDPMDYAFKGAKRGRPLSNMALLATLRRMNRGDLTAHGFRSTFRDWAAEQTSFPNEVVEAALAHTIADKVEAAYRRGDLFEKRRRLMEAWDRYCSGLVGTGEAGPIGRAA